MISRFSALGIANTPKIRHCKSTPNITTAEKRSLSSSQSEITKKRRKKVDKIQVFIRKRPLNTREIKRKEQDIVTVNNKTVHINAPRLKFDLSSYSDDHLFHFDGVLDDSYSNEQIYKQTAYPLVEYMFNGGKSTIFAYGQTGSGKTYTMLNPKHGLYTMAAKDIFARLNQNRHLTVYISYYEIYQSQLYDLLNHRNKLTPRDDGKGNIIIASLKEFHVSSYEEMMQVLCFGNQERTTGKTDANETSSRSHAILNLSLYENKKVVGKLNFIDLAGSERASDRGNDSKKTRMMEGAEINKSLLALKECIRALTQDNKFPPFRTSKLTLVLRDSFIGNSRTCMIATISPNLSNSEHTLNTLRYANR
ncbi:kinesin-domain-containing protein [Backusella circina FSU 941]|nr:kinesin-domain-containing protein [Backusella circina FSU 941]